MRWWTCLIVIKYNKLTTENNDNNAVYQLSSVYEDEQGIFLNRIFIQQKC